DPGDGGREAASGTAGYSNRGRDNSRRCDQYLDRLFRAGRHATPDYRETEHGRERRFGPGRCRAEIQETRTYRGRNNARAAAGDHDRGARALEQSDSRSRHRTGKMKIDAVAATLDATGGNLTGT